MMRYFSSSGTKTHPQCFVGGGVFTTSLPKGLSWKHCFPSGDGITLLFYTMIVGFCRAEALWAEEENPETSFPVSDPMSFIFKTSDSKNSVKIFEKIN